MAVKAVEALRDVHVLTDEPEWEGELNTRSLKARDRVAAHSASPSSAGNISPNLKT